MTISSRHGERPATSPRSRWTRATTSGKRTAAACTPPRLRACTAGSPPQPSCWTSRSSSARAREVQSHVQMTAAAAGRLCKSTVSSEVDASMIWLATPFALVDERDPLFEAAVSEISRAAHAGRRHPAIPERHLLRRRRLAGADGLARLASGRHGGPGRRARQASPGWRATSTGKAGSASSSAATAGSPSVYREWVGRWGHPARELLWSQAMYAVLSTELGASGSDPTDSKDDPTFLRR